jgi:hypothetical protein
MILKKRDEDGSGLFDWEELEGIIGKNLKVKCIRNSISKVCESFKFQSAEGVS